MVELRGAEELRVEYHQRLSLAAAPLTLFLLAIVLATRRRLGQRAAAGVACLATVIIVFVLMIGGGSERRWAGASTGRRMAVSFRRPGRLHPVGGGDSCEDWAA